MDNQHIDERYELYCKMLDELDESCRLIIDYDSVPHNYGSATLYQAESQIIHQVGHRPAKLPQSSKKLPVPALN